MPNQDDSTPVTRSDLNFFVETVLSAIEDARKNLRGEIGEEISASENRMLAVMENLRHDMIGTHKDKISQHEDRIFALEMHTGLKAA